MSSAMTGNTNFTNPMSQNFTGASGMGSSTYGQYQPFSPVPSFSPPQTFSPPLSNQPFSQPFSQPFGQPSNQPFSDAQPIGLLNGQQMGSQMMNPQFTGLGLNVQNTGMNPGQGMMNSQFTGQGMMNPQATGLNNGNYFIDNNQGTNHLGIMQTVIHSDSSPLDSDKLLS